MVQNVGMRLKGERGASLSFALLLMLVCTMVTAIVLAASTASFGQFANRAAMDQRYYSVTSAGEALRKLVLDKEVTVTVTTSYVTEEGSTTVKRTLNHEPSSIPHALQAITDLLFEAEGPVDHFDELDNDSPVWPKTISFTIRPSTETGSTMNTLDNTDLIVKVDGSMKRSGVIWLDLHNVKPDGTGRPEAQTYHLGMALSPDIQQTWDETVNGIGESEYTVTWGLLELAPGRDVVM